MIRHAQTFAEFKADRERRNLKCAITLTKKCQPEWPTTDNPYICDECWETVVLQQLNIGEES